MSKKKQLYISPAIGRAVSLLPEAVLLAGSGSVNDMMVGSYVIEGQATDGYYESDDIGSDWEY